MAEQHDTAKRAERVYIVGVLDLGMTVTESESLFHELGGLCETLGLEKVGGTMVKIRERHAAFLFGTGKVAEIIALAKACAADSIVFDRPLSPTQQRNWETESGLSAYDRHEVILRIFDSRAYTKEAAMQVELARLQYSLPRLAHSYEELSRQRGGRYGTKGSGEQKIELDRREILVRINQIQKELEEIAKERELRRRRRDRNDLPECAIVGYTNSGKSTLLNALTNASVLAEDKLFATLDPTTRRLEFTSGRPLLMTDTVGFIRKLPHGLIEAFKSTLEEVSRANLLVHVLDASDSDLIAQFTLTQEVLTELGADTIDTIIVLNKIDRIQDPEVRMQIASQFNEPLLVSVLNRTGMDTLINAISSRLIKSDIRADFEIPESKYELVALAYREGTVYTEGYTEGFITLDAAIPERILTKYLEYKK